MNLEEIKTKAEKLHDDLFHSSGQSSATDAKIRDEKMLELIWDIIEYLEEMKDG